MTYNLGVVNDARRGLGKSILTDDEAKALTNAVPLDQMNALLIAHLEKHDAVLEPADPVEDAIEAIESLDDNNEPVKKTRKRKAKAETE